MKQPLKHCCEMMQLNLDDGRVQIFYSPEERRYYINVMNGKRIAATQGLFFCPWCGTKLPDDLSTEYHEILAKEYAIDSHHVQTKKIPLEFQTDEWWKKRGL